LTAAWLRDLSDGYISFDKTSLAAFQAQSSSQNRTNNRHDAWRSVANQKPYFIGIESGQGEAFADFSGMIKKQKRCAAPRCMKFTARWALKLFHLPVGKCPSGIPLSSKNTCHPPGSRLFDVAHMGVYQAEGPDAALFLDSVCGNDIAGLAVGESCYTHFLDPDANVIDDTLVYRRGEDRYLVVVNASNDDKDWAWLNAVKDGVVKVDNERPWARAFGRDVVLRNLRDRAAGEDMRVDIALQGPKSRDILLSLGVDGPTRRKSWRSNAPNCAMPR
jgi:glycine hydroxymethyltransferase